MFPAAGAFGVENSAGLVELLVEDVLKSYTGGGGGGVLANLNGVGALQPAPSTTRSSQAQPD